MKKILSLCLALCTLSSCVTLFNGPYTDFKVHVPDGTRVIYKNECAVMDTVMPDYANNARIVARRSGTVRLPLTIKNDTFERTILVKPVLSWMYYANIYPLYGLGFLIDRRNPNRFAYPHKIYADLNGKTKEGYYKRQPYGRGDMELAIMPPFLNVYVFNLNGLKSAGSPFGGAIGWNYYFTPNRFVSVELGAAAVGSRNGINRYKWRDTIPPDPREFKSGWYVNGRHHHRIGRFDLGYGISAGDRFGKLYYPKYINSTYPVDSVILQSHVFSVGGSFAANVRLTNSFFFGINYQPQLFSVGRGLVVYYEHLVNFGFYWRVRNHS